MNFDVAIVGGSYSGLSAAMQLGRARRRVVIIDGGQRRNRTAESSHGFLGFDGKSPGAIAAAGKADVLAYPTVKWIDGKAVTAGRNGEDFVLSLDSGEKIEAKRVILALGVADELPKIPGVAERWGKHIFHCPFCHGYELNQGAIGVIATMPGSEHQGVMLSDWGTVTYFTNGKLEPEHPEAMIARGTTIVREPIESIGGKADVHLRNGEVRSFAGLFLAPKTRPSSDLAEQLGCKMVDGPIGPFIEADDWRATSVPGVFACGDAAVMAGSVALAVGDGAKAGFAAYRTLLMGLG